MVNKREFPKKSNGQTVVTGQSFKGNGSDGQNEPEQRSNERSNERNNIRQNDRQNDRNNQANSSNNNYNRYPNRQDRQPSYKDYPVKEAVKDNGPDNSNRDNARRYNNLPRYSNQKIKVDETIEDIKADIIRIEKEIELEIKEIKTLKLGL